MATDINSEQKKYISKSYILNLHRAFELSEELNRKIIELQNLIDEYSISEHDYFQDTQKYLCQHIAQLLNEEFGKDIFIAEE